VHKWELAADASDTPLGHQIIDFGKGAFGKSSILFPVLRDVTDELRWLIYFKGLLAAVSHPRDKMLSAIEAVRRWQAGVLERGIHDGRYYFDQSARSEALAAIARALSNAAPGQRKGEI
jgi:hypothetical protein